MATVLDHCRDLPTKRLAAGACLLEEGTNAGVLYVLAEGTADVIKGDVLITTVSDPGAFFGEMAVLLGIPHTATVRAATDAVVHVVADPLRFLQSHPEITLALSRLLAKRLHFVTSYLVDLKRQFEDRTDHFGLVDEVLENLVHHQEPEAQPGSERHPDKSVD